MLGKQTTVERALSLLAEISIRSLRSTSVTGRGPAYTETGVTYEEILKRLGDPISPISDDWLPDHGYAWVILNSDAMDNVNDRYPVTPYWFNQWSYKDRELWNKASHVLGKALRHPSLFVAGLGLRFVGMRGLV